jgi:hypothetical protein
MNIRAEYFRRYDFVKEQYLFHANDVRRAVSVTIGVIAISFPVATQVGESLGESVQQFAEGSVGGLPRGISKAKPEAATVAQPTAYEVPHVSQTDVENEILFAGGAVILLAEAGLSASKVLRRRRGLSDAVPELYDYCEITDDERYELEGIERQYYGYKD